MAFRGAGARPCRRVRRERNSGLPSLSGGGCNRGLFFPKARRHRSALTDPPADFCGFSLALHAFPIHEKTHWHRVSSARTPGRLLVAQETNDLGRPVVEPIERLRCRLPGLPVQNGIAGHGRRRSDSHAAEPAFIDLGYRRILVGWMSAGLRRAGVCCVRRWRDRLHRQKHLGRRGRPRSRDAALHL
jgi:hypothetical protein